MLRAFRSFIVCFALLAVQGQTLADDGLRISWQTADVQVLLSYADKSGLFSRENVERNRSPRSAARRTGQQDDWYADYIVHEQAGKQLTS